MTYRTDYGGTSCPRPREPGMAPSLTRHLDLIDKPRAILVPFQGKTCTASLSSPKLAPLRVSLRFQELLTETPFQSGQDVEF